MVEFDLPDEDGMAMLRKIRCDALLCGLPAVLYVEHAPDLATLEQVARLDAALAAGASDYASKPVDTGQLLAQLHGWLAGSLLQPI